MRTKVPVSDPHPQTLGTTTRVGQCPEQGRTETRGHPTGRLAKVGTQGGDLLNPVIRPDPQGLTWPRESNFICDVAPHLLSCPKSPASTLERLTLFFCTEKVAEQPVQLLRNRGSSSAQPSPEASTLTCSWVLYMGTPGNSAQPAPWLAARKQSPQPEGEVQTRKENQCPRLPQSYRPCSHPEFKTSTPTCRSLNRRAAKQNLPLK